MKLDYLCYVILVKQSYVLHKCIQNLIQFIYILCLYEIYMDYKK